MQPRILISLTLIVISVKSNAQPIITRQPVDQSVSLGASAKFQISATSTNPPILFQWQCAGTNVPTATKSSLTLTNILMINAGDYEAVVTDGSGSVTSRVAHLDVDPAFTKITAGSIVTDSGNALGCAWGDYDNDGFLDLLVANGGGRSPRTVPWPGVGSA